MPTIPDGTYQVTITNAPDDDWAEGNLVVATTASSTTMTYVVGNSTLNTRHNNLDDKDVSWTVDILNDDNCCTVKFKKGHYENGAITRGKATSPCFKGPELGDVEDSWTASTGTEHGAAAKSY